MLNYVIKQIWYVMAPNISLAAENRNRKWDKPRIRFRQHPFNGVKGDFNGRQPTNLILLIIVS